MDNLKKWDVDVFINNNLCTYITVMAKDKDGAEEMAKKMFKSPVKFKARKSY